ncbi:alpha/beta hydrolase-fold protein [Streptomyces sp. NPDC050211]|uniref:alpha/beta hydrolase n=1 Tax=Streptomyces sp. NPDC050211 TaxID=3154932 RepID=UPI0034220806
MTLALGAVMVLGCGHPPAQTAQTAEAVAATRTEPGIALVNQKRLSPRLSELTFTSSALDGTTKVRILLPRGYDAEKRRRYPVLFLYHGGGQSASSWTQDGAAEEITAGLPAIVVMPDAGSTQWYADWWNNGHRGRPMWETFHINRLLPWVDEHYRTIPERGAQAAAGLSMGGFGAVSYATRHPDLFGAVGSFSGDLDHQNVEMRTTIEQLHPSLWGPWATQEVRWRGDNPWDLAANLADTDVALYTGNGRPRQDGEAVDRTEQMIRQENVSFHERLLDLGIRHRWHDYGPGSHTWPYWQSDLRAWIPHLKAYFARHAHHRATPRSLAALTGHFQCAELGDVPPHPYGPAVGVVLRPDRREGATADAQGRLTIPLALGPGNPHQQYSPQADTASTGPSPDDVPFHARGNSARFNRAEVTILPR